MPRSTPSGRRVRPRQRISRHVTNLKAIWLEPDLIAWPAPLPVGMTPDMLRWQLSWSPTASLLAENQLDGPDTSHVMLEHQPVLPRSVVARHPEVAGYHALRLPRRLARHVRELLRCQVRIGQLDHDGLLLDVTGVQLAHVLDAEYAAAASQLDYGVHHGQHRVDFRLWAPTAVEVSLITWAVDSAGQRAAEPTRWPMTRGDAGEWNVSVSDFLGNARYLYRVKVYMHTTGKLESVLVTDPYAVALTLNSTHSVVVDPADPAFCPPIWQRTQSPRVARRVDGSIYELHIRDFSAVDEHVPPEHRGTYLAFADDGNAAAHLRRLAKAGINTVHLLPSFDFSTVDEDRDSWREPPAEIAALPPDSHAQQQLVDGLAGHHAFNWGYDPWHWMTPDGAYASVGNADGGHRIAEFRTMVGALHEMGLRVVLDAVFNHTSGAGLSRSSVLDRIVPGYYHRLNPVGSIYTSTCCQNVATERPMAQKLMVDACVHWARTYRVDGFRFDLMGHSSRDNLLAVRAGLDQLTPHRDGVDGASIWLYGEGWNFGEVADNALFVQASQGQLGGTGIGCFSDRLRDAVRGGGPLDADPRRQGFGSGEFTDPNSARVNADAKRQLAMDTDLLQLGLAGNLIDFGFTDSTGMPVTGGDLDYHGDPAGFANQPDEVISYVDAHDNETLWDALTMKLPHRMPMTDRIRMNTLCLATVALAQTPMMWHAGADVLRSKSFDRNSFNSGDWFNRFDPTGADNGFGRGLPPERDNGLHWDLMRPLLRDPALKPTPADVRRAADAAADLLRLRTATPLLRLGDAELIRQKVSFPASGTPDAVPGVVAMHIDDRVGARTDHLMRGVLVVFNATPWLVEQVVPGLTGVPFVLSPIQANGADPVATTSRWDAATSTAHVPARTVALFVHR